MPSAKARTASNKRRSPANAQAGAALSKMRLGMDTCKPIEALQLSLHGRQEVRKSRGKRNPLLGVQNLGADAYAARLLALLARGAEHLGDVVDIKCQAHGPALLPLLACRNVGGGAGKGVPHSNAVQLRALRPLVHADNIDTLRYLERQAEAKPVPRIFDSERQPEPNTWSPRSRCRARGLAPDMTAPKAEEMLFGKACTTTIATYSGPRFSASRFTIVLSDRQACAGRSQGRAVSSSAPLRERPRCSAQTD